MAENPKVQSSQQVGQNVQDSQNVQQPETQPDSSHDTLPAITVPKGGGAIHGIGEQFSLNAVTGTASTVIPIATSEARSGFSPKLNLTYDSGSGNDPFGFGWHLSLPSITRKTDKGLPRYQDVEESDIFILTGVEELLPVVEPDANGFWTRTEFQMQDDQRAHFFVRRYRPRVEGSFSQIERWTESQNGEIHWRSISKDNVTTIFGDDENSRIFDPKDPSRVFSWLVSQMFDDRGNIMKYEYKPENSQGIDISKSHERMRSDLSRSSGRYPKRIKYGNRNSCLANTFDLGAELWMFEVVFDYGDHDIQTPSIHESRPWASRSDPFSTYRPTFELRTYRLCNRVLMFHHFPEEKNVGKNCLVSSLDLSYRDTSKDPSSASEGNSIASFISSAQHISYLRDGTNYLRESLPPIEFEYSHAKISDVVRDVDPESLRNLPSGVNDAMYEFLDLNGEGLSGILSQQGGAFFYNPNVGKAHFGPIESVSETPSLFTPPKSSHQWLDLAGDGKKSLVQFDGKCPGFYKRNTDIRDGWVGFRTFTSLPAIPWGDPNVKLIDLRGTGLADVLILDDEIFTYYPAMAEEGFGPASFWRPSLDEDEGPRVLSSDKMETIFLADFSGDGLNDIVRVRNGEICYWPNLGYSAFGAKISMDNAPWFDTPDLFRQTNIKLADIDGSGTTDIVYVGGSGVSIYLNQSGNSWTNRKLIETFPLCSDANSVQVVDLLGQGTSCLVWSSSLPSDSGRQLRYINLLSEGKPYLMTSMINNLGAETHINYSTSTSYYLADKAHNKPWATKLPFPVHVVSEVETLDRINGNRFLTRHSYHEGYYDGVEREFRGFGFVESSDTEDFLEVREDPGPESASGFEATNFDPAFKSPPVLTKTWYHTGAFFENTSIMKHLRSEFYDEPGLDQDSRDSLLLPETKVPSSIRHGKVYISHDLSPEEERESYRSLRGSILRQEIYSIDGTPQEMQPYQVTQHNYTIDMLQPRGPNRYAMYFTHPKEDIQFDYERTLYPVSGLLLADPRVSHTLDLATDEYGNVLESVKLNYGRRHDDPNPLLNFDDRAKQKQILATLTLQKFTNAVKSHKSYRTPLLYESETFELINFPKTSRPTVTPLIRAKTVRSIIDSVATGQYDLPFQDFSGTNAIGDHIFRRRVTRKRTLFRSNDLARVLNLGKLESLALSFQDYTQVFTNDLARDAFLGDNRFDTKDLVDSALERPGGFVHSEGDENWWRPSGKVFFSPNSGDSPSEESEYAQRHFYLPHRYRDPFYLPSFDTEAFAMYDKYDLLVLETRDALGNQTTIGTRTIDSKSPIEEPGYDYRPLAPLLVMDPNRNRTAAVYDILGHVTAIAIMGKPGSTEGDDLSEFVLNLTESEVSAYLNDPMKNATQLLGNATSRTVYDFWSYHRTKTDPTPSPVMTSTISRETHVSDLEPGQETRIQQSFLYSDGFGRAIQTKSLTGPDPSTNLPRWVASGWECFNNKGSVVRKYEPFFTNTNLYESNAKVGVSSTLFYDPLQRVVANLYPNHSWSKTSWDSWGQEVWDQNDTILIDPAIDIDVSGYFHKMPGVDYLPTWYTVRTSGQMGTQEKVAAMKAAVSASTPNKTYFDALGRSFVFISHNALQRPSGDRNEEFYTSRNVLDISGNIRQASDNLGRTIEITSYNMENKAISKASMEAGEKWTLFSVTGQPLFNWNSRGFQLETIYDQLRRPLVSKLRQFDGQEFLVSKNLYGESESDPENFNLKTRIIQSWDQATVKTFDKYDFKGNLLSTVIQNAANYSAIIDWTDPGLTALDPDIYKVSTTYDALNRIVTNTQPDTSIIRTKYNLSNQVQSVDVKLNNNDNWKSVLVDEQFNARNQRILTKHGNGAHTKYTYDQFTFSLLSVTTFKLGKGSSKSHSHHGVKFQDLHYTYDPMKNITHTRDEAQQTIFFKNQVVDPSSSYTYDALYRLIEASGREHLGQSGRAVPYGPDNTGHIGLQSPGNGNAMGTYTESYRIDPVGNITSLQHSRSDPTQPGWTRGYKYEEPSQLQPELFSNRLTSTTVGRSTEHYKYKANAGIHGNPTSMGHLSSMEWDFRDRLQSTAAQHILDGTPETTWYSYLDDGTRARKATNFSANAKDRPSKKSERLYLEHCEIYREYAPDGSEISLERKTLHIMNGNHRLAMIDSQIKGPPEGSLPLFRYQYTNILDSSMLELDEDGQLISYEEYFPYGSTSYQAVHSQLSNPKRYRYTGKERDEESGFYYHGARYYAPWIGRWISPDPIGIRDDPDLYAYVKDNPIMKVDPTGTQGRSTEIGEMAHRLQTNQAPTDPLVGTARVEGSRSNPTPQEKENNSGVGGLVKKGRSFLRKIFGGGDIGPAKIDNGRGVGVSWPLPGEPQPPKKSGGDATAAPKQVGPVRDTGVDSNKDAAQKPVDEPQQDAGTAPKSWGGTTGDAESLLPKPQPLKLTPITAPQAPPGPLLLTPPTFGQTPAKPIIKVDSLHLDPNAPAKDDSKSPAPKYDLFPPILKDMYRVTQPNLFIIPKPGS